MIALKPMEFLSQVNQVKSWLASGLILIVIFLTSFPHYLQNNTFFWVSVLTIPLSINISNQKRINYFAIALAFGVLAIFLPATIVSYMALCLILLFLVQKLLGSIHVIAFFHLLLASPFFTYFSTLISFPIRLEISQVVVFILKLVGYKVSGEGNLIYLNDELFLVDQACAGLFLLGYGLLFGTLIISHFTKSKSVSLIRVVFYYFILFDLIIFGNISRITLLVIFNIPPEHWLHETIGLLVYLLQILLPFYLIVKLSSKKQISTKNTRAQSFPKAQYLLLCVVFILGILRNQMFTTKAAVANQLTNKSINLQLLENGVYQAGTDSWLLYLKPPVAPYKADHNPMICWKGSGYNFKKVEKLKIDSLELNVAELVKGEEQLYTAWWFESDEKKFGSQLKWRLDAFLNSNNYYLVNITSQTKEQLLENAQMILDMKIISQKKS